MNKKALFALLLSILTLQTPIIFAMSKIKLVTLATGLGASYAGWNEYKQWTGPQPSPTVQKWVKKTLKSQGASDIQLNTISIEHDESGFFTTKRKISTTILHANLRIAQYKKLKWSIEQYRKRIVQGKSFDPVAEIRNYTAHNFLAEWSIILAHELAHLQHKDYKKGFYYELKKELKSLPSEITQSVPTSHQIIHQIYWYNNKELIASLLQLSPTMEKLVNEIHEVAEFLKNANKILKNRRENNSTEYAQAISDTFEFPRALKQSKEVERNADRKAIEVYSSDPEKLWAAAFSYQHAHNIMAKTYHLDAIDVFDQASTNKIPTIVEELISHTHPTDRERAFYFADAARKAEELIGRNR